jgi:hypothetical protein
MVKLRFIPLFCMVAVLTAFAPGFGLRTNVAAEETVQVPETDVQVLASGPIHEAFAEAVALNPEPGIVVPKAPPDPIEEIPPELKPAGGVEWIPGYWAWDDDRNDFIWVSGIWRVPPPGRQWIPGYWEPVNEGYQWISGYWAKANAEVTKYLPEPPESVEVGPSSNAPSTDYTWVPGCWLWHDGRYAWRPGYWTVVKPDRIWVPDHYVWTPRGYIFIGGYWDYIVIRRGVLFAPVFFPTRLHFGLTFSFSPGVVINLSFFDDALFLRPRYCHYYYGDYYAPKYFRRGIYPWFSQHARRVAYDPIYAHQRWTHRNDHEWENRLQTRFYERREKEGFRAPKGFNHRAGPDRTGGGSGPERLRAGIPLDHAGITKADTSHRFTPLNQTDRREFLQQERKGQSFHRERRSQETRRQNMPDEKALSGQALNRKNFSSSPMMDKSNEKAERNNAPPARYQAPKPNPHAESLKRRSDSTRRWGESQKTEDWRHQATAREQRSMADVRKYGNRGGYSEERVQNARQPQRRGEGRQRRDQRLTRGR